MDPHVAMENFNGTPPWNCYDCPDANGTEPGILTNGTEWEWSSIMMMAASGTVLGLMILATIIGNVFVIAAVFLEKNLQNVANYLIVSLAVADLMVACLVMPLGAVYEISKEWIMGQLLCDMWTSSDVLCCTASILHLVAIAVDRYWAVTDIEYIRSRNRFRINSMIFLIWLMSTIVSLAPFMGWRDADDKLRVEVSRKCLVSQDMGYQIFASCSTFYVPLCIILLLYWRIWKTARRRIRHRPGRIQELNSKTTGNGGGHSSGGGGGSSGGHGPSGSSEKLAKTPSDLPPCSRETTEFSMQASPANMTPTTPAHYKGEEEEESLAINTISRMVESVSSPSIEITIDAAEDSKTSNGCEEQPLTTLTPNNTPSSPAKRPDTKHMSPRKSLKSVSPDSSGGGANTSTTTTITTTTAGGNSSGGTSSTNKHHHHGHHSGGGGHHHHHHHRNHRRHSNQKAKKKETIEAKRERKAAKTLAIITGAFVMCWLPFFIMTLTLALCGCDVPPYVFSIFLWLGYFNSTLNPIIYTLFSPEFRMAFKRILCGNRGRGRK